MTREPPPLKAIVAAQEMAKREGGDGQGGEQEWRGANQRHRADGDEIPPYRLILEKKITAITRNPQCRSKNFFGKSDGNIFLKG